MQRKVDRSLVTGAAGVGMLAVAVWLLPGVPSANQQRDAGLRPARVSQAEPESQIEPDEKKPAQEPAPPSFERYRRLLEMNPFSPRLPKKLPGAPPPLVGPPAPVLPAVGNPADAKKPETAPPAAPPKAPEPPDPLKDWVYSGTVAIGGDVYAVVENKASKQGRYLKTGDNLEGATVDAIAQSELSVTLNGAPRTLAKSSAFSATPLNAAGGAAPANPGGNPGQPGGPGGPMPAGGPPPGGPGGPVMRRSGPPPTGGPVAAPTGVILSAPVAAPAPSK